MSFKELAKEIIEANRNDELQLGLKRAVNNYTRAVENILNSFPELIELSEHVRLAKDEVLNNLDYYINQTVKSIKATGAHAYFADDLASALEIVDGIIGKERKLIIKAKSMVADEIGLREHLTKRGHEVYETDLGELLLQLGNEKPMHTVAPALHLTKKRAARLLRHGLRLPVTEDMRHEEIVLKVREFFREKFLKADVGISGANAIAADTGAIFLVHNEGNISNVVTLPPAHIVITGVEKIMPTFKDAVFQVMVQSGYAGLYPPTYVNVISGPSARSKPHTNNIHILERKIFHAPSKGAKRHELFCFRAVSPFQISTSKFTRESGKMNRRVKDEDAREFLEALDPSTVRVYRVGLGPSMGSP